MQLQSRKKQIIFTSLLCFSAIVFPLTSQAITVQEVPNPRQNHTWVTDKANILSDSTETQLNQMIAELEAKNGSEIAVVTVPDTKPSATPKAFATELFNFWRIGKKGKNNGVLLLISSGERRVQIETGSGLQSILPDARVVRIIKTEITPRFKQQDFDGGTLAGTTALVNVLQTPIANVQSQTALPLAPIVPSQEVKLSPIPSQSPVISSSTSTGEDTSNLIYGLLALLFIAFIAFITFFIPCFFIFKIFRSLFSGKSAFSSHRRYPRYSSNNRNYSSSHNYCGGAGYNIINISSDDCGGYYSTNSSDYSISNSDCGGSFGGGESTGGGAGADYSSDCGSSFGGGESTGADYSSDCGGSFGGGESTGGGAGADYSSSDCGSSFGGGESTGGGAGADYSSSSSSDYSSSSDSSSGGGGGDW
ncbi:TPM domain-containing protein [Tychonema sp. LEGE 07199]|uniref:TPM domain-containing protein n=1 Tax=unclassified Tychonema TaxID=2642144 RepID=UPI00187E8350|nr:MULTISPECIES: TPM domain-containing protein [unclassified Tychonema]MBE9124481.1 TPM domain-containing protein [Tychonema sp. LEGE 07199]MBE9134561.1 TPM domain-containing protein [Tychonema sp. LEGE 07196]